MNAPLLALVSARLTRALTRESARCALACACSVVVVDLDGTYVTVAGEPVWTPLELGMPASLLHVRAAGLEPTALVDLIGSELRPRLEEKLGQPVQLLPSGVLLQSPPGDAPISAPDWETLAAGAAFDLSSTGELLVGGSRVPVVDLAAMDTERPWLINAQDPAPGPLLSRHPALASFVADVAARVRADAAALPDPQNTWDFSTTSLGTRVDEPLRFLYRKAVMSGTESQVPDPYDPARADAFHAWLTTPSEAGGPARYLAAVYDTRQDLRSSFPRVPGDDTEAFLAWVDTHGRLEGYPPELLDAALRSTRGARPASRALRPVPGVTVVGYLTGELGIGESARQLVNALSAAGVPHATRPIGLHLASCQRPAPEAVDSPLYDTTVICVNADLTPTVAAAVPDLLRRSYRIGMWYWEVEDFPPSQHGGFAPVDEVWVATDFIRRAIEPHSPVPVRTLTPPLPQRGPDPTLTKAELGLPDAPVFLFSFDYLSTAERKNPLGLVEAFERAFRPGEGPVLVIKSINADKRVADAERLRIRAASRPDVLLLEDYLEPTARDALVAHCDCYVSLHRSEGLGLTMAEAMAWGKPVIATGYSGNLQFMTEDNSFLVPWSPAVIPADAAPYPSGGVWADPDLESAARLMRLVADSPDVAAARGARAAQDIAMLHSAEAAGQAVAARLAELRHARRARSHPSLVRAVRRSAHAAVKTLRDELR